MITLIKYQGIATGRETAMIKFVVPKWPFFPQLRMLFLVINDHPLLILVRWIICLK
jgi:hypothetical protein